jgi:hypothetical protein
MECPFNLLSTLKILSELDLPKILKSLTKNISNLIYTETLSLVLHLNPLMKLILMISINTSMLKLKKLFLKESKTQKKLNLLKMNPVLLPS